MLFIMSGFKFKISFPPKYKLTKKITKLKSNKVFYHTQEGLWVWRSHVTSILFKHTRFKYFGNIYISRRFQSFYIRVFILTFY